MDEQGFVLQEPRPELGKEQKVGLIFVIICGAGAVILGAFYVWNHLAAPFIITYTGPQLLIGDSATQAEVARAKAADTDSDGLSDYDEKNVYGTSPYLSDTDSDGIDDRTEVTSGTDPLCKTGATCTAGVADSGAFVPDTSASSFTDQFPAPVAPVPPTGVGGDASLSASAASGSLTAGDIEKLKSLPIDKVRETLISSGAEATKINAMADADVQKLYLELLATLTPTP
ncbi:MAG: hypothetical protein WC813_03710 [Patescibacteria group bacterium]|jgi:hypothetical protein